MRHVPLQIRDHSQELAWRLARERRRRREALDKMRAAAEAAAECAHGMEAARALGQELKRLAERLMLEDGGEAAEGAAAGNTADAPAKRAAAEGEDPDTAGSAEAKGSGP